MINYISEKSHFPHHACSFSFSIAPLNMHPQSPFISTPWFFFDFYSSMSSARAPSSNIFHAYAIAGEIRYVNSLWAGSEMSCSSFCLPQYQKSFYREVFINQYAFNKCPIYYGYQKAQSYMYEPAKTIHLSLGFWCFWCVCSYQPTFAIMSLLLSRLMIMILLETYFFLQDFSKPF